MTLAARGDRPTILVIGSISRDVLLHRAGAPTLRAEPGGVVHHSGLTLATLGAKTRVVTRASRRDAPELLGPLRRAGVEVRCLESAQTTSYANDYSGDVDRHLRLAESDPIGPGDVPSEWYSAAAVQLGPLHPRDVLPEVASLCRGIRGLDVQGLVRETWARETRLAPYKDLGRFLEHVEVVQASEAELSALLAGETLERFVRRFSVQEMLVTQGARGATVVVAGDAKQVAASAVAGGSTVGSGDVFLGSYLLLRVRGLEPVAAARGATEICAARIRTGNLEAALARALARLT